MRASTLWAIVAALAGVPAGARAQSVFDIAPGTWSWSNGDSTCIQQHRLKFSPDRALMFIEYPPDSTGVATTYRYDIIAAGPSIHPGIPYVVRARLEDETRTTADGEVVVWDLIVAISGNRYHWHRTDWPDLGVTGAIIRCDGAVPLEQWPPSPVAPKPREPRSS